LAFIRVTLRFFASYIDKLIAVQQKLHDRHGRNIGSSDLVVNKGTLTWRKPSFASD
jgi:hypothetical protein